MKKNRLLLCAIILTLSNSTIGRVETRIQKEAAVARELRLPNPDFTKLNALIQALPLGSNRTFYEEEMVKKQAMLRGTALQQPAEQKPKEQRVAEEQRMIVQESIKKEEEPARKEARTEFNNLLDTFEQTVAQQEQLISQSANPEVFYTARFDTIPIAGIKVQKAREKDLEDPTRIQARKEDIDRWVLISQRGSNVRWKLLDKAQKAVDDLTAYVTQHPNANDQQFKALNEKAGQELQNLYSKIVTKIAEMGPHAGQAPIELFEVLLQISDPENNQPGKLAKAYSAANEGLPFPEPDITAAVTKINHQDPNGLEYLRTKVAELKQKSHLTVDKPIIFTLPTTPTRQQIKFGGEIGGTGGHQ